MEVVLNVEAPAELKASTAAGVEPLGAARGNCETATGRKPGSGATWTVWKNDWGRWVEVAVSSDVADGSFMICCADCAARATREAASEATAARLLHCHLTLLLALERLFAWEKAQ